jgi:hypothetical protein
MSIQNPDHQIEAKPEADESTSEPLDKQSAPRRVPSPAAIRRRAIIISLGVLVFLLIVGLGEAFGGFLPHTTAPFANGRTQTAGTFQVTLQFSPNPPKYSIDPTTLVQMTVKDQAGQAIDDARVHLSLTMLAMDMGVDETPAQGVGQGHYQARVAFLMPGAWQVTVMIAQPGSASGSTTFDVDVAN